MKARRTARLRFPPYKVAAPASPFFPLRQRNVFCKTSHLHAYKVPASASPFLTAEGDETRSKKRHILMSVVTFSTNSFWMRSFRRKYCTIKDGAQTYDFIADKSCLLFSIILKVLSGWEVIRTHGKCIKSYKNFWKDFVVEQNLTRPNRQYGIVVVWDDWATGNMDPWSFLIHCTIHQSLMEHANTNGEEDVVLRSSCVAKVQ